MGAIKVSIGDEELRLGFRYIPTQIALGKPPRMCLVRSTQAVLKSGKQIVDVGTVFCSPTDQFEKAEGRKRALTRALLNRKREIRRKIWNAYWQATNRGEFVNGEPGRNTAVAG